MYNSLIIWLSGCSGYSCWTPNFCRCCCSITAGRIRSGVGSMELPWHVKQHRHWHIRSSQAFPLDTQILTDAVTSQLLDWCAPSEVFLGGWLGSQICTNMVIGPLDPFEHSRLAPKFLQVLLLHNRWTDLLRLKIYAFALARRYAVA